MWEASPLYLFTFPMLLKHKLLWNNWGMCQPSSFWSLVCVQRMAGMWRITPQQCTEMSPSRASTLSNGTVQKSELQNGALKPGATQTITGSSFKTSLHEARSHQSVQRHPPDSRSTSVMVSVCLQSVHTYSWCVHRHAETWAATKRSSRNELLLRV